ncbi:XRE family transcriptional regulator [Natronospirillum operosum]|uniref:XRE family transcriptional regulator n=1 Tax=Natronospirillum operosum TaxID=2759953 RepID=A0A4Z0WDI5_9GAMM|nr:helix-turn-helix transcriptional regulator [Natronospirillum operosum]TGG95934.1 XRE family transcriptional regulator [Natronospirillum operosum]
MNDREATRELGQAIARRRKEKGLTQAQVAEFMGIEKETVSRIENGAISPTLQRLKQFAEILDCSLSDLFRTEDDRSVALSQDLTEAIRSLSPEEQELVLHFVNEVVRVLNAKGRDQLEDELNREDRSG